MFSSNGVSNVAIGIAALSQTTNRSNLVAVGDSALLNNGTGATPSTDAINNTVVGSKALYQNNVGSYNTALGFNALWQNSSDVSTALYFKTGNGALPFTGAIKTIGESTGTARIGLFTYASASGNGLRINIIRVFYYTTPQYKNGK